MKAYVVTTGTVFGLLVLAHVWRLAVEGTRLMRDPWFVAMTIIAAALSLWALRLLRKA